MVKPRLVVTSRILSIYNICVHVKHNPIHTSLYQIISGIYKQNKLFLKLYKTLLKIQKFNIANIAQHVTFDFLLYISYKTTFFQKNMLKLSLGRFL